MKHLDGIDNFRVACFSLPPKTIHIVSLLSGKNYPEKRDNGIGMNPF
jgi:hypothetical protein